MKDVLVLVATEFQDTELVSTVDVFQRNGVSYDLVSIENKDMVKGQNEAIVATKKMTDVNTDDYKSLFLPGGRGHKLMLANPQVLEIVKKYAHKHIFAICAGPSVLVAADVITDKFTSHPNYARHPKNTGNLVEVSERMVTGKNFVSTLDFAHAVVGQLQKLSN